MSDEKRSESADGSPWPTAESELAKGFHEAMGASVCHDQFKPSHRAMFNEGALWLLSKLEERHENTNAWPEDIGAELIAHARKLCGRG